ncbi:uncharacterized protein CLUP02_16976 [Colletotrichum lupini]|uniref:Uncharacterized protein n=1 Tax=Colletotrichum lupini TaxID=145971 RepID=A0A9Q8T8X0_9PEZI|nr:uncharacterized protein CLUP02_16976 [Colletotrichum lupini]UQC91441.1 hypothetical protein CLUP02_16976 [Colletotrichum lupini]
MVNPWRGRVISTPIFPICLTCPPRSGARTRTRVERANEPDETKTSPGSLTISGHPPGRRRSFILVSHLHERLTGYVDRSKKCLRPLPNPQDLVVQRIWSFQQGGHSVDTVSLPQLLETVQHNDSDEPVSCGSVQMSPMRATLEIGWEPYQDIRQSTQYVSTAWIKIYPLGCSDHQTNMIDTQLDDMSPGKPTLIGSSTSSASHCWILAYDHPSIDSHFESFADDGPSLPPEASRQPLDVALGDLMTLDLWYSTHHGNASCGRNLSQATPSIKQRRSTSLPSIWAAVSGAFSFTTPTTGDFRQRRLRHAFR